MELSQASRIGGHSEFFFADARFSLNELEMYRSEKNGQREGGSFDYG